MSEAPAFVNMVSLEYHQSEIAKARADLDAVVALAIEAAVEALNERGIREQAHLGLGREAQNFYRARDIVRALIQPHQAAALARVRQEAHNAAMATLAVETSNNERVLHSRVGHCLTESSWHVHLAGFRSQDEADAALRVLALPVDGGAKG